MQGDIRSEWERDWSDGLGATLSNVYTIKNYFSNFMHFFRKANSVTLLGFECTINPQNVIKIVGAIFEKIEIFNFFLMWTALNFKRLSKKKK